MGASSFTPYATDQVVDYALDLKNFHETSHNVTIAPVLIASEAGCENYAITTTPQTDKMLYPIRVNSNQLRNAISRVLEFVTEDPINPVVWEQGGV